MGVLTGDAIQFGSKWTPLMHLSDKHHQKKKKKKNAKFVFDYKNLQNIRFYWVCGKSFLE